MKKEENELEKRSIIDQVMIDALKSEAERESFEAELKDAGKQGVLPQIRDGRYY